MNNTAAKKTLCRALAFAGMLVLAWSPARADDMADIGKLVKAGKTAEALNKANEFLTRHPADPQMRFMKGVLLTEQNKSDEAIAVFTKLTEDYRDLPEPYNNLAVLYAASGQYDKARITLEKAIRTNPSYMTAYENLGDVYGKLASQAYDKALALSSSSAPAKSKLTLLRNISSNSGGKLAAPEPVTPAPQIAQVPVPTPTVPPRPANNAPPLISQIPPNAGKLAEPQRIPALSVSPPVPVAKVAAAPVPVPVPAPVLAKAAPVVAAPAKPAPEKPAKPDTSERDAVLAQVNGWAKAWTSQNVDSYLGYYSQQFEPPKGLSRKAWADERRARIEGKGRIRVEVGAPEVVVNGNTARVSFHQTYESDRLTAKSRKTLVLVKNGGKWQIKQESSGG